MQGRGTFRALLICRLCCLALRRFVVLGANQLVEVGLLAIRGVFLIDKLQAPIVEFLEEVVPRNLFQLASLRLGALGNSKRRIPGSPLFSVPRTSAGTAPRASAHLRISS